MSQNYLLVDNGTLMALWQIGGLDALEHLFDRGLTVVIPEDIISEIREYDGSDKVREWVKNSDRIIRPNYYDPVAAEARIAFRDGAITEKELNAATKNAGDRAIKALASGRELDGNTLSDRPSVAAQAAVSEFAPDKVHLQRQRYKTIQLQRCLHEKPVIGNFDCELSQ